MTDGRGFSFRNAREDLNDFSPSDLGQSAEAALAVGLLVFGLISAGSQIFLGVESQAQVLFITAILLFGVVEIPRIRNIDHGVRLIAMSFLALHAMGVITILADGVVRVAAPTAILLLFTSTLIVLWAERQDETNEF